MFIAKTPALVKMLYPGLVWQGSPQGNTVYLTFDDGPTAGVTDYVLDTLDVHGVKATFFLTGNNAVREPALYNRLVQQGHAVGNHTYNHLRGWNTPTEAYVNDVLACSRVVNSRLFRPPYGRIKYNQIRALKRVLPDIKIIMWSVLSVDYNAGVSPGQCLKNVVDNTTAGSIIVFHDSVKAYKNLKPALPECIMQLKQRGYNFGLLT